VNVNPVEGAV